MDHRECRMKQEKIAAMERIIAADYANIAGMVVLKDGECIYENSSAAARRIAASMFSR